MRPMSWEAAERLGYDLYDMGFSPVPDIDDDGRLLGVRLWRARAGMLEYITLRPSGLATAGRVVAEYDYRRPFDHGEVIETRRGHVVNTLRWLLSDMDLEVTQPIPVVVPVEVAQARHAARGRHRHTQPWDDPNRLMAGRAWEADRDCAGQQLQEPAVEFGPMPQHDSHNEGAANQNGNEAQQQDDEASQHDAAHQHNDEAHRQGGDKGQLDDDAYYRGDDVRYRSAGARRRSGAED